MSHSANLGENIRSARQKVELTQLALAHKIGRVGPDAGAAICRMESGTETPRLETLYKIAAALGTDIHALLKPR